MSYKEPNMSAPNLPQSRYVLPSFVERTSYGIKEMNPYNKLFEERIIFLGVQIDDASANDVMAQLITLESIDPDREITMYINSPGGSMTSMMAIYDTMQFVQPEIMTCCIGQAASAAAVLLAAGTKGKRVALPNSRILIHQPATEVATGSPRTWRSRPARSSGCGPRWSRSSPATPAGTRRRSAGTSSVTSSSPLRKPRNTA
jgi:ATP-dependent Clp protease protease subunit